MRFIHWNQIYLLILLIMWRLPCVAQQDVKWNDDTDILELSLEELLNVEVTSVAKKPQMLKDAASAIFVLTEEDIRRSGATTIADALRLVPGVQVARLDANKWAISIRGFNDIFSNKLLVLMDGRSVYTPFFGGVYWDIQDTVLEDIERIEIIRGPGGTLWGANAVNGVINIITKSADETQGTLFSALAGNEERATLTLRHGGHFSENDHYRLYAKAFEKDKAPSGADDWRMLRGGFRVDGEWAKGNSYTLQGDVYTGTEGERATPPAEIEPFRTVATDADVKGGNVLFRWKHAIDSTSEFGLQAYYDRAERSHFYIDDKRDIFDLDLQHRFLAANNQEVLWGVGYRHIYNDTNPGTLWRLDPESRSDDLVSAFVQDEITLIEDRLSLTVGSKFEHNDFTGFEYQPSIRLLWSPASEHSLWAAVSRAIRRPSRVEHDATILRNPLAPGLNLAIQGDRGMDSEELIAYEFGYRLFQEDRFFLDAALFYNDYNRLRSVERVGVLPDSPSLLRVKIDNKLKGESYGFELAAKWLVSERWHLDGSYSYLDLQLHLDSDSTDVSEEFDEGDSPHHQFVVRSSFQLTPSLDFETTLRYVDSLSDVVSTSKEGIDSYLSMDLRGAWRVHPNLELSLVGRDLLSGKHREFRGSTVDTQATEVEPSFYLKLDWRF